MEPPEICLATQTALKLLDMARDARPGARQNLLVEVSTPKQFLSSQDMEAYTDNFIS